MREGGGCTHNITYHSHTRPLPSYPHIVGTEHAGFRRTRRTGGGRSENKPLPKGNASVAVKPFSNPFLIHNHNPILISKAKTPYMTRGLRYDRHTLWSPVSISDQMTSFVALRVKQLAETMKFFNDSSMSVYQAIATPSAIGTTAICHSEPRI